MKPQDASRRAGAGRIRGYAAFLSFGAVFAVALLVRQLFDLTADANVPALRQNDMYSAAGSVAMPAVRKAKQ